MEIDLKVKRVFDACLCLRMLMVALCITFVFPFLAQAGPILKVDSKRYHAGEVYAGKVVEHKFVISNTGDEPLEVQRVRSS